MGILRNNCYFLCCILQREKPSNQLPSSQLHHLLLDRSPNIEPLISCWELGKLKNCWNKSFRTSKVLTLLHQQFSNFLIYQRGKSGPRLGALSNNRWLGVSPWTVDVKLVVFQCPENNDLQKKKENGKYSKPLCVKATLPLFFWLTGGLRPLFLGRASTALWSNRQIWVF